MSSIDIVILVIVILTLIRGFIKGFIMQLAGLAALLLGIYMAIHFSAYLGKSLFSSVEWNPVIVRWVSFAVLFALVVIAVHFVGKGVEKLAKITQLSFLNRIAGAFFSGIKAIFILAVLVTLFCTVNKRFQVISEEKTNKSIFYNPLSKIIPALFPRFFHKTQPPAEAGEMIVERRKTSIIKGKYYLCENFSHDPG